MNFGVFRRCAYLATVLALLLLLGGCSRPAELGVIREVPWSMAGHWLVADTHTHSRFSDGSLEIEDLVTSAALHGCDVLAVTDHSDLSTQAATPAYFVALEQARRDFPELILLGGIEWNIPPYGGREHVTVLLAPALVERVLPVFRQRFEQDDATAKAALQWLAAQVPKPDEAVLIYNHPSRKDEDVQENARDMLGWLAVNHLFIGFEGAPGHQNKTPVGSYHSVLQTEDRWDPVAAQVGGVWDSLLDQGHDLWAALAVSDYHNDNMDYAPCAFSRTHILVPERSAEGVLRALRAGSFWADTGRVLDGLTLRLAAEGLLIPISPGETARIDPAKPVTVQVSVQRNPALPPGTLQVEVIGNGRSGRPELLASRRLGPDEHGTEWTFSGLRPGADGNSAYFRVRVRSPESDGPDRMAYTNPLRVVLNQGSAD